MVGSDDLPLFPSHRPMSAVRYPEFWETNRGYRHGIRWNYDKARTWSLVCFVALMGVRQLSLAAQPLFAPRRMTSCPLYIRPLRTKLIGYFVYCGSVPQSQRLVLTDITTSCVHMSKPRMVILGVAVFRNPPDRGCP